MVIKNFFKVTTLNKINYFNESLKLWRKGNYLFMVQEQLIGFQRVKLNQKEYLEIKDSTTKTDS